MEGNGKKACLAINGRIPFDLVIRNVHIVNVFTDTITDGDIAIVGDTIAYTGRMDFDHSAGKVIDGGWKYAVPGLIDAHMHIESSMMAPAHFIELVLARGTTAIAADPHEIGNVFGVEGVRALTEAAMGTPLHVFMMAPSTIPSAPGFERAGASVGECEMAEMLDIPGVLGMGEMMDFNGIADGDERILDVTETARQRGVIMDGHVPALSGRRLQAFRAAGMQADHTDMALERAKEKLAAGFSIQVQRSFFSRDIMDYLNHYPLQDRIMLITDDIPYIDLIKEGHLNANVRRAVSLGLDPVRAVRFATINAATRLRLYDRGAVSAGYKADILLADSLEEMEPSLVLSDGQVVAVDGECVFKAPRYRFPDKFYHSVHVAELEADDFAVRCQDEGASEALVNVLVCNREVTRTAKGSRWVKVENGVLKPEGLLKIAVIYRHGYGPGHEPGKEVSCGFAEGFPEFRGAIATTYAHDSHNLMIFGTDDADMALAADRLIALEGGLCAVLGGEVLAEVPLPVAGLLTEEDPGTLTPLFEAFFGAVQRVGLRHDNPMTFITLMALAVSLEIKVTDMGLIDVRNKQFMPLIAATR